MCCTPADTLDLRDPAAVVQTLQKTSDQASRVIREMADTFTAHVLKDPHPDPGELVEKDTAWFLGSR